MKLFFLLLFISWVCGATTDPKPFQKTYSSQFHSFKLEKLVEQNDVIWGFDFLPDGRIIFTEREGKIGLFDPTSKKITEIKNVPAVWAHGQGGMLDLRVHPNFSANKLVFITYSKKINQEATTALASAQLEGTEFKNLKDLFIAKALSPNEVHFGSRIEFASDQSLYISVGERDTRNKAQELSNHHGKILHLTVDGKPAPTNPWLRDQKILPEIISYGHRNPQGLAYNKKTHQLFEAEFGPQGGDEINIIKPKANYGWPVITYGREYWGPKIGEGFEKKGMEQPIVKWVPSISPSALTFYEGHQFPSWKDNLFLATLSGSHLRRLMLSGDKVVAQEELLMDLGWRFRNVRTGPDGDLYFSTDEGLLVRMLPAK